jgi:hypothetical protein
MSKAGDTIENPVTKERIVVRVGTEDSEGELLEVDTYVGPGGAVTGEHVHPSIEESFTVVGASRPPRRTTGGMPERRKRTS